LSATEAGVRMPAPMRTVRVSRTIGEVMAMLQQSEDVWVFRRPQSVVSQRLDQVIFPT
jgi:hypothetical protein